MEQSVVEPIAPPTPPAWAQAVIVAELHSDDSDIMTDYFNVKTVRTVPLAWSKHTRDLFSEMRQAALRFEETKHLGPGCDVWMPWIVMLDDIKSGGRFYAKGERSHWHSELLDPYQPPMFTTEAEARAFIASKGEPETIHFEDTPVRFGWDVVRTSIEHREKYSMGHGYYLKASGTYSSGWTVTKRSLKYFRFDEKGLDWSLLRPQPKGIPAPPATPSVSNGRYATSLDDDVREVLQRSAITATSLTLPPGQLSRDLYVRVNKVLEAAGGKWNRSARAHLFSRDPRETLGLALTNGAIVDQRKALQQFFTSPKLAATICRDVQIGDLVLEPSAGGGQIGIQAQAMGASVLCVEIDAELAQALASRFTVVTADFLTLDPSRYGPFDKVLMNPPFADGQDLAHVTHAMKFLRPGGQLRAVMSAGVEVNQSKAHAAFRALFEDHDGTIERLPDDSFKEAGTGVRTVLVTMEAPHVIDSRCDACGALSCVCDAGARE